MDVSTEEYEAWRAARHAAMPATDPVLLAAAVRRATGDDATAWERIVGGEVNEVHTARLDGGREVVVRVSRQGAACRFEAERWAIAAAAAAGVPVPEVLAIEHLEDEAGALVVCVERRIAGRPLDEVDPGELERLTGLAGEVVARLHAVEMPGCGWVGPDGSCPSPSWARVMHLGRDEAGVRALAGQAVEHGIAASWVLAAAAELERHDDLFAAQPHRLLHGDLSLNHVLTDGERITGLIDLEQAFAGDPAFELVRWDYFRPQAPVSWLIEGYRRERDLGPDVELRVRLGRLRLHLALVEVYGGSGHHLALRRVQQRFAEDAAWFGFA